MSIIIDRIGDYAKARNLSIRKIEHKIGAGNGTISKAIGKEKDIQTKWLTLFLENYSEVNPVWLLTGKGEMIKKEKDEDDFEITGKIEDPEGVYHANIVKEDGALIDSLKKIIHVLERQLHEKERVILLKDRIIRDLEEKLEKK